MSGIESLVRRGMEMGMQAFADGGQVGEPGRFTQNPDGSYSLQIENGGLHRLPFNIDPNAIERGFYSGQLGGWFNNEQDYEGARRGYYASNPDASALPDWQTFSDYTTQRANGITEGGMSAVDNRAYAYTDPATGVNYNSNSINTSIGVDEYGSPRITIKYGDKGGIVVPYVKNEQGRYVPDVSNAQQFTRNTNTQWYDYIPLVIAGGYFGAAAAGLGATAEGAAAGAGAGGGGSVVSGLPYVPFEEGFVGSTFGAEAGLSTLPYVPFEEGFPAYTPFEEGFVGSEFGGAEGIFNPETGVYDFPQATVTPPAEVPPGWPELPPTLPPPMSEIPMNPELPTIPTFDPPTIPGYEDPEWWQRIIDWAKNNPEKVITGIGTVGSIFEGLNEDDAASGGGAASDGWKGPITNYSLAQTYTPAPANYRPGFDPEHVYLRSSYVSGNPQSPQMTVNPIPPDIVHTDDPGMSTPYVHPAPGETGTAGPTQGQIGRVGSPLVVGDSKKKALLGLAQGGIASLAPRMTKGPGDGLSDSIPATIEGQQPAVLSAQEFVVPADVVSHLGNGSSEAGAQVLYDMMDRIRHARTGNKQPARQINPAKLIP